VAEADRGVSGFLLVIACDKREAFAQGSASDQASILHMRRDGLLRFARNDEMTSSGATNWRDGQITKSLSSPFCKNILLNLSGKSPA